MVGIYKIENKINGHIYIGQSVNIYQRWNNEKSTAFNPTSSAYNSPLSKAFRKYGIENFVFEVIEECGRDELNNKERYWINHYDSFYNGYNQTLGGDGGCINGPRKESIIGVINDLKTTNMLHKQIADKWGISTEMVQGINTGRYWYSDFENYPLQERTKKKREKKEYFCIDCGRKISKKAKRCVVCSEKEKIKMRPNKPSKEELHQELIKNQGNFTVVGKKYGVTRTTIHRWCEDYNIPSMALDYKIIEKPSTIKKQKKKISQIDMETGAIIAIYSTPTEAAKAIGKPEAGSHITQVCKGTRKMAYKYYWKYIE